VANNAGDDSPKDVVDKAQREGKAGRGPWARLILFLRQVLDELSKVVTPTEVNSSITPLWCWFSSSS